ncbi:MAG: NINE protein [Clostridia bacterium]|nr:NINE protein [Clostridia bacterium]
MYCRNCGKQIEEQAAICVACGYKNGDGDKYCFHCGANVEAGAQVCLSCGYSLEKKNNSEERKVGTKSKLTAGLLGIFLGGIGVHNFYFGYTGKAVAQIFASMCTLGIGGIWGLIEGILILCGKINKDANGNLLQN